MTTIRELIIVIIKRKVESNTSTCKTSLLSLPHTPAFDQSTQDKSARLSFLELLFQHGEVIPLFEHCQGIADDGEGPDNTLRNQFHSSATTLLIHPASLPVLHIDCRCGDFCFSHPFHRCKPLPDRIPDFLISKSFGQRADCKEQHFACAADASFPAWIGSRRKLPPTISW